MNNLYSLNMKKADLFALPLEESIYKNKHCVRFWENDNFLAESVSSFINEGLINGEGAIVIATEKHLLAIITFLTASGIDVETVQNSGQLSMHNAEEVLTSLTINGQPDAHRFNQIVGNLISNVSNNFPKVRAYGEMVGLLWNEGNTSGTIHLEKLWIELGYSYSFSLLYGYSLSSFKDEAHFKHFEEICLSHTHVLPSESFRKLESRNDKMRAVELLEQQSASLQIELERRRVAESALRKSEEHLNDFFDNASIGFHWVNEKGIIIRANRSELDLLGYTSEEYIGHSIGEFHADQNIINDIITRLWNKETIKNYSAKLKCKDGSIKHVLIDSNVLFENDQFIHTRCFTRDVTDQVQAEEAMRHALEVRNEFMSVASHELKTPLTSLILQLQMRKRAFARGEFEKFEGLLLSKIITDDEKKIRRLIRLVDDMLDITRMQTGKLTLELIEFDLCELVHETLEYFSSQLERAGTKVTLKAECSAIGRWDHGRIEQVLNNLLTNTIKYGAGNLIEIHLKTNANFVKLTVIDNGAGIANDDLERIFQPFERAISPNGNTGLGLGLFIAKQIVEEHGGTISVQSELNIGSTFTVELPLI